MRRVILALKDSTGASALEFAVVAPFLMLLIFGMIEFGWVFQNQLAITHAAREGARLAAVNDGANWDAGVVESRAYPLTTGDGLGISLSEDAESVTVSVTYPYEHKILPFADFPLESTAVMRKE